MSAFSDNLRRLRKDRQLTQPQLSEKLGISRSAVGMYESGSREPDLSTLCKIADIFGVGLDELVGRTHPLSGESVKQYLFGTKDADDALLDDVKAYAEFSKARSKR